ncbi:DUF1963 domain-containing protein [Kineosphaera limosa]|nr:DUF1963 domain-containing protein [Kineosphaera limosa]
MVRFDALRGNATTTRTFRTERGRLMTLIDPDRWADLSDLAHRHLPAAVAREWLGSVRPAVHLVPAQPGDAVIATLGGSPLLPTHPAACTEWPQWPGHGPLSFVGEVDLEALATSGLDTGLTWPAAGRLLMFFFDGVYDDFESVVDPEDPSSQAGARLIRVTAPPHDCAPTPGATGVRVDPELRLTGRQALTLPESDAPAGPNLFADDETEVAEVDRFYLSLQHFEIQRPSHQIGGWPIAIADETEHEAAIFAVGDDDATDPRFVHDSLQRRLILQIDSTPTSRWGDAGTLYWLTLGPDATDPTSAIFTWQSR